MKTSTHIGFQEYRDSNGLTTSNLYDGHFDPTYEGTAEEVGAYLESFLYLDAPEWESLKWEGPNGWFYQGAEAGKMLRAQIANLKDGSCFLGGRVALKTNDEDHGMTGEIIQVCKDGLFSIRFDDGEQGFYSPGELELEN